MGSEWADWQWPETGSVIAWSLNPGMWRLCCLCNQIAMGAGEGREATGDRKEQSYRCEWEDDRPHYRLSPSESSAPARPQLGSSCQPAACDGTWRIWSLGRKQPLFIPLDLIHWDACDLSLPWIQEEKEVKRLVGELKSMHGGKTRRAACSVAISVANLNCRFEHSRNHHHRESVFI